MRISIALLITTLLLGALAGCGGVTFQSPVTLNLSGTWQFAIHSNKTGTTVTGTGALQQNGSALSGQLTLSGTPCATVAAFTGSVNGTNLSFQLQEGTQPVAFSGTVGINAVSASGNYTAPSGGCTNGDAGTWTASKI